MKSAFFLIFLLCHGAFATADPAVSCEDGFAALARAKVEENIFVEDRDLGHYRGGFCCGYGDEIERLKPGDVYLDVGSGQGKAIATLLKQYRYKPKFFWQKKDGKPVAIGVSVVQKENAAVKEVLEAHPENLKYIIGKFIEEIPASELGRPKIISDYFGALSYTSDFRIVLQKYLDILRGDGKIFLRVGMKGRNRFYKDGRELDLIEFLKAIPGLKVEQGMNDQSIGISKYTSQVRVPKLKLKSFKPGSPPSREYEIID